MVDALLRLDRAQEAAQAIDDHAVRLHAFAAEVANDLAGAAVEREAEHVLAASRGGAGGAPGRGRRWMWAGRLLSATVAAVSAFALALPQVRPLSPTDLGNAEGHRGAPARAAAEGQRDVPRRTG